MSPTAVVPMRAFFGPAARTGEEATMEDLIAEVWRELQRAGAARCPVCRETMERVGARGRCRGCGSAVS